jgi:hypothetical protein
LQNSKETVRQNSIKTVRRKGRRGRAHAPVAERGGVTRNVGKKWGREGKRGVGWGGKIMGRLMEEPLKKAT